MRQRTHARVSIPWPSWWPAQLGNTGTTLCLMEANKCWVSLAGRAAAAGEEPRAAAAGEEPRAAAAGQEANLASGRAGRLGWIVERGKIVHIQGNIGKEHTTGGPKKGREVS